MEIEAPERFKHVRGICSMLHGRGYDAYLVGGCVRDLMLGKRPKDIDIVTNADPDTVESIFTGVVERVLTVGKSFGVVKVVVNKDEEYEIATYRKDIGEGRRPDTVEFTDLATDIQRRDFTINGLVYDINKAEIIDYCGGMEDIKNETIQTIGNAEDRFREDPLRKLRALRFASRIGFGIMLSTVEAIIKDPSLPGVSPERIRDEFLKSIEGAIELKTYFHALRETGMEMNIFGSKFYIRPETRNKHVLLASLLSNKTHGAAELILRNNCYTLEEVNKVSFLISLKYLNNSNAYRLKKRQKAIGVTDEEVREYTSIIATKRYEKFISYQPTVDIQALMEQGFEGKELGDEIAKRESLSFACWKH